jgi:hypothetical protein
MSIDLHIHSTASDGALAPAEVVAHARAGALTVIALADHDTIAGVAPAVAAAGDGVRVLPAIEISATHEGREIHLLGYDFDPEHPAVTRYDHRARSVRAERIREMIRRLAALDVHVAFDAVVAEAGPDAAALARPHLARVLWNEGHVPSVAQAFDRFIGDHGPAFVPVQLLDAAGAIAVIHEAGGLAVWAHPPVDDDLAHTLDALVEAGLDGLECLRPRSTPVEVRRLTRHARRNGLLVTGGSDWHGDWHGPLGGFHVDREQVAGFLDRVGL